MILDNPLRRLAATHPAMELWWDSSPLVYDSWLRSEVQPYAGEGLFVHTAAAAEFAASSLLRGATTNPPLVLQVLKRSPEVWGAWLRERVAAQPGISVREAMWQLYIEIARRGAARLAPLYAGSVEHHGRICCQVDPRDQADTRVMVEQARRIHAASPSIMIKMPGTREGIAGVRILTAEGISTTVTLCFTVAQLVAVGEAVAAGLAEAQDRGTTAREWRSCAVMMLGRYEDAPQMKLDAEAAGVTLSEADLRWAGIAIFRKAYHLFRERRYPSKLMAASMRVGPIVDGVTRVWHLERLAGASSVLTIFPNIMETFLHSYRDLPITAEIDAPVPADVLARLLRIPYFCTAYDEDGLAASQFITHPALHATAESFAVAMSQIEEFAASHMR